MSNLAKRKLYIAFLFLALAFCLNLTRFTGPVAFKNQKLMSVVVPERLRGFFAARLWEKADDYMHAGPAPNIVEPFSAGSYAGNTDILPLLKIITRLVPSEPAPWLLLADNLARYLGGFDQAVSLLQQAIIYQSEIRKTHQFYAAIAYLKLFVQKPDINAKKSALKYLQAAVAKYDSSSNKPAMHGYNLEAYFVLLARLYLENGEPESALRAWKNSHIPLNSGEGKLASLLLHFEKTGQSPDPGLFAIERNHSLKNKSLVASESICRHPPGYHDHKHKRKHALLNGRALACLAAFFLFATTIVVKKRVKY